METVGTPRADRKRVAAFIVFLREFYMTREHEESEASARAFLRDMERSMTADYWPPGWTIDEIARYLMESKSQA